MASYGAKMIYVWKAVLDKPQNIQFTNIKGHENAKKLLN